MNADEDWLRLVGDLAREDARRDEDTLAEMARSDAGRRLLAPLDEEARARIAAAAFRDGARPRAPRAKVIAIGATSVLAAAAAFAVWSGAAARAASLPPYEVSVSGGSSALRGAVAPREPSRVELHAASPFELVLRPNEDVKGPVAASAFLVEAGEARGWSAPIEVSPAGAVRIAGRAGALFATDRGDRDVLVIVARPGALPDAAHAVAAAAAPTEAQRVARVHVTIAP